MCTCRQNKCRRFNITTEQREQKDSEEDICESDVVQLSEKTNDETENSVGYRNVAFMK